MSKEALTKVVQRSIGDSAFRRQIAADPSGAFRGYDLTADEINAMQSRDVAKLSAYGIDLRMSKVFITLDPGAGGSASLTAGSEPRDVAPVWIGDGSSQALHTYSGDDNAGPEGAVTAGSEPRDVAPVWIGDGSSQALHTYSGDDNAGPEGALTVGTEPRDVAPVWIGDGSSAADSVVGNGYATDEGQLTNDSPGAEVHITTGDGDLDQ